MASRRRDRPDPHDESRIRKALGGAATPLGLRERILAALDAVDRRRAARRPAASRSTCRRQRRSSR